MLAALRLLALLQQGGPQIARVEILPAQPEIRIGQTLQLTARALDASGTPVPGARVIWFGNGEGSVDSTGLVRGGFRGAIQVVAMATAPGSRRVVGEARVKVLPAPASAVRRAPSGYH